MDFALKTRIKHARPIIEEYKRHSRKMRLSFQERVEDAEKYYLQRATKGDTVRRAVEILITELYPQEKQDE